MEFEALFAYDTAINLIFYGVFLMFRTTVTVCALSILPVAAFAQDATKIMPVPPVPAPAPAKPDEQRLVSVSGQCVRSVIPDRGLITVTASKMDPASVKGASEFVMKQYEQFRAAVEKMELKDLTVQTSDYNVTPMYQWVQPEQNKPGKQVLQGYQARLGLTVRTSSIDRLGDVIAKAGELGVAEVGGFQLTLADATERKIREDCLTEAVQNAQAKAQKMVAASGAKLGPVMVINESVDGPVMPMYSNQARMMKVANEMSDAAVAPSVQPGATTIQVSVQAAFAIE